jgi:hypothetical protein
VREVGVADFVEPMGRLAGSTISFFILVLSFGLGHVRFVSSVHKIRLDF